MRVHLALASVLLSPMLHADSLPADKPTLEVWPQICVAVPETPCKLDLQLKWRGTSHNRICILSDNAQFTRWCNDSNAVHSLTLNITTDKDIQFEMVDPETNRIIADAKFRVTQLSEPQKRRRYRNPWSLF
ncbi:DUF3019 domain-containing protein [Shewanella corallii]|uniref:DUF3019 domain-containing protein n=1 Tax=Shewanella corallii TaxID=560080 RepID=A0ABT0N3U2_9GAMM|nr:DUF3019 domain-containing protein [Shewanella corallii]